MKVTAFDVAQRFVGLKELRGKKHHPLIQWGFMLCSWDSDTPDEVPWCSAFAQIPAHILRLPRSKSARARSWLQVGRPIVDPLDELRAAYDVVILRRGGGDQPGPEVIEAPGHVGFFAGLEERHVLVLGGNQGDAVSIRPYPVERVLGYRRLKE